MVLSDQVVPGMIVSIQHNLYRVETSMKVNIAKGASIIKVKLKDLTTQEIVEKNLKPTQTVQEVNLQERRLEFLYPEGDEYLFLDISTLDQVLVSRDVVGDKIHYLKEGVEVKGLIYNNMVYALELPQFLELMVAKVELSGKANSASAVRRAILETGASIEVPPFIEAGDIVKVDTHREEYAQRV